MIVLQEAAPPADIGLDRAAGLKFIGPQRPPAAGGGFCLLWEPAVPAMNSSAVLAWNCTVLGIAWPLFRCVEHNQRNIVASAGLQGALGEFFGGSPWGTDLAQPLAHFGVGEFTVETVGA